MARPKSKSALVDGVAELVNSLRKMEAQLNLLIKLQKKNKGKRGRPVGSGKKTKSNASRPAGNRRGPGRPPGSKNK
jgi:hypothetical protein